MKEESILLKQLTEQFPSLHREDGSDLYFNDSSFIIVADRNFDGCNKIYCVQNLKLESWNGYSDKLIVPTDEKGNIVYSLKDYKEFNYEDKKSICEHLNKIIKLKKELDIEIKKQELEKDFKNDSK